MGGRSWARCPPGGAGQVWVLDPEAPALRPMPVTGKGWHQLVECTWAEIQHSGLEALFLLCFVYSNLPLKSVLPPLHPRARGWFGYNVQCCLSLKNDSP